MSVSSTGGRDAQRTSAEGGDGAGQRLDDPGRLAAVALSGLTEVRNDEVFDRLTRLATRSLGAPVSLVSIVTDTDQHFPSHSGLPLPSAAEGSTPLSHSFCQHVVTTGERLVVHDARADPRVEGNLAIAELGVQAYAGVPLRDADGNVLGSFCVIDDRPRRWTEAELEMLGDLAAVTEYELRSRLAIRKASRLTGFLDEVSEAFHADLEVGAIVDALGRRLVPGFADVSVVDLVGRDGGPGATMVTARTVELHREAMASRGTGAEGGPAGAAGPTEAVPVVSPRAVAGTLTVARASSAVPFDADEVRILREIGRRLGVAIDNARSFTAEHDAALSLQNGLLPTLPDALDLDVAVRYLPSGRNAQVGGDWYDILPLDGGGLGVAVGDVAGHDMAAAARMGQLSAVLRSYAWEGAPPGTVLDRVCRLVRARTVDDTATVFYAILSQPGADGSRRLTYAAAGHPPPVVIAPDGSTAALDGATSPLIGVETPPRPEAHAVLAPGSYLVCYTDGLVERRGRTWDEGTALLHAVRPAHSADELAERIVETMTADDPTDDDVALLVLRV